MCTTPEVQRQEWDDTAEGAPEEPTFGRRHLLLGGAVVGFTLAASGLLLPMWLQETAAWEGALDGARGGRRGRGERGHHHRTHGDRKGKDKGNDKDQDKPRGLFRGIRFTVSSHTGSYPVEFYVTADGIFDFGWNLTEAKTVAPDKPITFATDKAFGALWIEGRYFLSAKNELPTGTLERVGLWGNIDPRLGQWNPGTWWDTGSDFGETTRTIRGARPVVHDDLRYVHFLRRPDSHDYLEFEVYIQPLSAASE